MSNKVKISRTQTLPYLFINACQDNDIVKVNSCINLGVEINTVSEDGLWSGLTIAAKKNYIKLLDILLTHPNIDVNLATSAVVVFFEDWPQVSGKRTPLMIACQNGNHEIVDKLLQIPNINITFANDFTALHYAAAYSGKCTEALGRVEGLDWNIKGHLSTTPLYCALKTGCYRSLKVILSKTKIDFNIKRGNCYSVAERAVITDKGSHIECLKMMLKVEAIDWNKKFTNGDTPLRWCVRNGKMEKFKLLIECPNVNLNLKDSSGDTVAMWALKTKRLDFVKILATNSRLDARVTDRAGETLVKVARLVQYIILNV